MNEQVHKRQMTNINMYTTVTGQAMSQNTDNRLFNLPVNITESVCCGHVYQHKQTMTTSGGQWPSAKIPCIRL